MLPNAMPSSLNNNINSNGGQGNGNSVVSSERIGGGIASMGQKSQGGTYVDSTGDWKSF